MTLVEFKVIGIPAPQGSTRAFVVGGRAVTTNKGNGRQIAWRDSVAHAAHAIAEHPSTAAPLDGPLGLSVEFRFPMPKSRPKAVQQRGQAYKESSPDLDKLIRCIGDALTAAGLVKDDARFVAIEARKIEVWDSWTGAIITINRETTP